MNKQTRKLMEEIEIGNFELKKSVDELDPINLDLDKIDEILRSNEENVKKIKLLHQTI